MPLHEAEDGSLSIGLPEDPIQFERLLTYLYQGTWAPESPEDCGCCYRWGTGEVCGCWDTKQYMQLYALVCNYEASGL